MLLVFQKWKIVWTCLLVSLGVTFLSCKLVIWSLDNVQCKSCKLADSWIESNTLLVGQQSCGVAEERKFSNLLTYLYLCIICTIVCRPAVFWKFTCTCASEEDCAETWGAGPLGGLAQGRERSALNPQHPRTHCAAGGDPHQHPSSAVLAPWGWLLGRSVVAFLEESPCSPHSNFIVLLQAADHVSLCESVNAILSFFCIRTLCFIDTCISLASSKETADN